MITSRRRESAAVCVASSPIVFGGPCDPDAELVAYFPAGTDLRPEGHGQTPDRVRVDARDYVCVFVDPGPRAGAPVRGGLRAVS